MQCTLFILVILYYANTFNKVLFVFIDLFRDRNSEQDDKENNPNLWDEERRQSHFLQLFGLESDSDLGKLCKEAIKKQANMYLIPGNDILLSDPNSK